MVYSVNLTRCFGGDELEFYHLAVCSTAEKAVEFRREIVREHIEGGMFDVCVFDENGNLLTKIESSEFEISIAGYIGTDTDDFIVWSITNNDTYDYLEVVIKAMEIDKLDC